MLTNLDMIHKAIRALGAVANEDLAAFVQKKYGVRIDP